MDINEPLHEQIHLWIIVAVIVIGYAAIVANKIWIKKHVPDKKTTNVILILVIGIYMCTYTYLTFFYRERMAEAHVRLEPFWSYKEAFEGIKIVRLSVARSIILNIAITCPMGYLFPAVLRDSAHRFRKTIFLIFLISIGTEVLQGITRTGLCETDDVMNNMLGGLIGLAAYILADKLICTKKKC